MSRPNPGFVPFFLRAVAESGDYKAAGDLQNWSRSPRLEDVPKALQKDAFLLPGSLLPARCFS